MDLVFPRRVTRRVSPATVGLVVAIGSAAFAASSPAAGSGKRLAKAPASSDTLPPPVIEVVPAFVKGGERLRIEALVSSDRIRRVDFLVDGELAGRDRRFPFSTVVETPSTHGPNRIVGLAFDRQGVEIARDVLLLDRVDASLSVSLSEVRELAGGAWLEVGAEVHHSPAHGIERVDFYRDERYVASVSAFPYRARIPGPRDSSFVRAVAVARDGRLAEAVRVLDASGEADSMSVSLVEVYAMVSTPRGAPVTGLAAESFELRQDGRRLPIERFSEGDSIPLSLALVIDGSGSMYESLDRAKQSAREFLSSTLDQGDRALLIDFASRPRVLQDHTDDIEALVSKFDRISSRGGSAVYDAILFGTLRLEGTEGRRALVVLTDGLDSTSRISTEVCAEAARRAGVPIFVLELGPAFEAIPSHRALALRRLAAASGGGVFAIRRSTDVAAAYESIETQLRGQYLLGFSAERSLSPAELDALSVRISDQRLVVRTILGGQVRLDD